MIQLEIRSRTKNPPATPSAVKNATPPKNLRLRNPAANTFGCFSGHWRHNI